MRNINASVKFELARTAKHELKILPQYYDDVMMEKKCFELRVNDRNYQTGDTFLLREWIPEYGYTGRWYANTIEYVLKDCPEYGLEEGYCIFGW